MIWLTLYAIAALAVLFVCVIAETWNESWNSGTPRAILLCAAAWPVFLCALVTIYVKEKAAR